MRALALLLLVSTASAQEWEATSHGPGAIYVGLLPDALAVAPDGDVFLPATCVQCGGPFDGIPRWDAQTGTWGVIEILPDRAVNVRQLAVSGGSLYATMQVNQPLDVGGERLIGLAGYDLSTGTWDDLEGGVAAPSSFNNIVYDLEVGADGRVYVGGEFETAGGSASPFVAAWDPATRTWDDLGGGPGDRVFELAVGADGTVYASGSFSTDFSPTAFVVVYDPGADAWSRVETPFTGTILGLEIDRAAGTLYAVGALGTADGARFPLVAYDGGSWTPIQTPGPITTGAEALRWDPAGALYVAGHLGPVGGVPTSAIERLDLATNTWTTVAGGVAGRVGEMEPYPGGEVAVAGNFAVGSSAAVGDRDVASPGVIVSDPASGWRSLGSSVASSGPVSDAATAFYDLDETADGASVYGVGVFQTAGDAVVNGFARWDLATRSWNALGDGIVGAASSVAVGNDGGVYLANVVVAGVEIPSLLGRWDPGSESWSAVGGFDGLVRAFGRTADRRLLLVGPITVGGTASRLVLFDPSTGALDALEGGPPEGSGTFLGQAATVAPDGTVYLAVNRFDGAVVADVFAFDPGARTWTELPDGPGSVAALALSPGGELFAAGFRFEPRAGVLRFDAAAGTWETVDADLRDATGGLAFAPDGSLVVVGNRVYRLPPGASRFTEIGVYQRGGGSSRTPALAFDADGGMVMAGHFRQVGTFADPVYSPHVARWTGLMSTASGADPVPAAFTLGPNPTAGRLVLRARLAASATVRATVHDVLGREVARLADGVRPAGPLVIDVDLGRLPAGVYLVRLAVDGRAETRHVTVAR